MAAQRRRSDKLLERMKNNPSGDWKLADVEILANDMGFQYDSREVAEVMSPYCTPRIRI